MRRCLRALCAVGALVVALAGCADLGGVPVTEPTGLPAGTRLAEWLVSPPGTVVLGSPFPRPDGSFAALLLVTGRPVAAVRDVLRQAADAGFTGPSYARESTTACLTRSGEDWADSDAKPLGSDIPDDTRWLTCEVNAEGPATAQGDRRFGLSLVVGTGGQPYLSHVYLQETRAQRYREEVPTRVSPHVEFRGPGGATVSPGPSVRMVPPLPPQTRPSPLDTGPPNPLRPPREVQRPLPTIPANAAELDPPDYPAYLPGPGQPLAEKFAPGREDYRVLDGSQLVGPEFPSTCATGGFHAVLRLDAATIDDYDEMARAAAFNGVSRAEADPDKTFRYGDGTATYRVYNGAGAGEVVLAAVSRPRAPTFLMLSRCND